MAASLVDRTARVTALDTQPRYSMLNERLALGTTRSRSKVIVSAAANLFHGLAPTPGLPKRLDCCVVEFAWQAPQRLTKSGVRVRTPRYSPMRTVFFLLAAPMAAVFALPSPSLSRKLSGPLPGWTARWIWVAGAEERPRNYYALFRKTFNLPALPRAASVRVTADSRYQLFVNGTRVGRGPARCDRRWQSYDEYDLTPHLKLGGNVVAALVHHYGEFTFQYMLGRGGFLLDGEVVLPGEERVPLHTDASWRARPATAWQRPPGGGPRINIMLGYHEVYDARQEEVGWQSARFDDSGWPRAAEIGPPGMEPWPRLVPREIPPMAERPMAAVRVLEIAEVEPAAAPRVNLPSPADGKAGSAASLTQPESQPQDLPSQIMAKEARRPLVQGKVSRPEAILRRGAGATVHTAPGADVSFLIDFGREVTGYPHFRVRGARGGEIIDMGYGEALDAPGGGFLPPASGQIGRLDPDHGGMHYADRFICRPGSQEFQTFDKRAFRYMQVDVRHAPEGIRLDDVGLLFSTYPVEYRGEFRCSDERLNQIWEMGRWTVQLNMEDGYTDCPHRERGQWWGDVRVEALINYYAFGDPLLMRKALRQKAQSQSEEGITWGVYPTSWEGGRLSDFTLIWIYSLWEYYWFTGDLSLARELYPNVRRALDVFFEPRRSAAGLLADLPYWVLIDWAGVDKRGEGAALNAFYIHALEAARDLGRLVGDSAAADRYAALAEQVRTAFNRRFWDEAQGCYRDCFADGKLSDTVSEQTNSLAVLWDIADEGRRRRVLDRIRPDYAAAPTVRAGSPYFSFYVLAALYRADRHEQALAYIRERWGRMLDWGATTCWEVWEPTNSLCHGWSAGPTHDLPAEFLGVKPLAAGWREFLVRPRMADLRWARGAVPTPWGEIHTRWQRAPHRIEMAVTVPPGTTAMVVVPTTGLRTPEVRVNGEVRRPRGVDLLPALPGLTLREGERLFRVTRPGSYRFVAKGSFSSIRD
ncbi:MAG: family 78 glycoside hydrolase catalytic domain [Armatimonadetes bacterium]|nr:family 78 glycoside hydrolase catalytic domain [Armatimonadota bacterium]